MWSAGHASAARAPEDIPRFAQYFVSNAGQVQVKPEANFSDAMACLATMIGLATCASWRMRWERALVLGSSEVICLRLAGVRPGKRTAARHSPREVTRGCQELEEKFDRNALEQREAITRKPPVFWGACELLTTHPQFELRGVIRSFPSARTGQAPDRELRFVRGRDVVASSWQLEFHQGRGIEVDALQRTLCAGEVRWRDPCLRSNRSPATRYAITFLDFDSERCK